MRSRQPNVVLLIASLALTASCYHKTQLAATWREPNAPPLAFHKTVTVFVTKDEALRRSVEDKLASKFQNGVPSYRVIASADTTGADRTAILNRFRRDGFDGAVIMRVTNVTMQTAYVPGAYWYDTPYTFGGYWNLAWAYPYDPGYAYTDQIVTVETQIYNLNDDKLIFAARSETTNAATASKLADSVIRHIMEQLKKDRLIVTMLNDDVTGRTRSATTQ